MIGRLITFIIIKKTFFMLKKYLKKNLKYISKFVIILALKLKFAFLI